jgi:O-antigen ligase
MLSRIKSSLSTRNGIDRAIWIALLSVVGAAIFSIALVQLAVGVLAALWLVTLVRSSRNGFRSTVLDLPMLVFIMGRSLSIPFSTYPGISVYAFHIEIIFYIAFFVFTNTVQVDRENEMTILIQMLIWTGVLAALIGICEYAIGASPRATSSTAGPYTLGTYLVAVLPLALLLAEERRFFKASRYGYVAVALLVLGVIFTFDRLHWIVMAITFVVAMVITKDRRPLVAFLLLAALAILFVPSVAHRFQLTMTLFSHMSDRDVLWRGAAILGSEHPVIGFGPRTFREIFPLMAELGDRRIGSWHNDFLQVYMESGLVGLVPLLWLIAATFTSSIRAYRSRALPPEHQQLFVALLLSLSIFVVAGGMLDMITGLVFRLELAVIALIVTRLGNRRILTWGTRERSSRS